MTRAQLKLSKGNMRGLPVLPDELLLEIISYFIVPPPPSSSATAVHGASVPCRFERREALTSLLETCQSLRMFLRPYLWDRIEVCSRMIVGNHEQHNILEYHPSRIKKKAFSWEILRQLEVTTVINPTLAQ